jgi:hypothetical protein
MMGQQHQTGRRNDEGIDGHRNAACGQTADTAKASAKAVVAWPEGKL